MSERKARRSHISEREMRRPLGRVPRRAHSRELRAMRMCERSEQIFVLFCLFYISLRTLIRTLAQITLLFLIHGPWFDRLV